MLVALLAGAPWNHSSADLLRVGNGPTQEDTDPDTGKVIKTKGDRIGTVRITTVDAESSQGELIELVPGTAAAKGCVLSRPPVKKDAPGQ